MRLCNVTHAAGFWKIEDGTQTAKLHLSDGRPVSQVPAGGRPVGARFASGHWLVEWQVPAGHAHLWVLAADGLALTTTGDLRPDGPCQEFIRAAGPELRQALWQAIGRVGQFEDALAQLTPGCLVRLLGTVRRACPPTTIIAPDRDALEIALPLPDRNLTIAVERLNRLRALDVSELLTASLASRLEWPSLFGEGTAPKVHALVLTNRLVVIRCQDTVDHPDYLVVISGIPYHVAAIVIPDFDMAIVLRGTIDAGVHLSDLVYRLAELHAFLGKDLSGWLRRKPEGMAVLLDEPAEPHFGRYLWTELSGLGELALRVTDKGAPLVYALGAASGHEFFGPIEIIFPEFAGRIVRSFSSRIDALRDACKRNIQVLPNERGRVSRETRQRVARAVERHPDVRIIQPILNKALSRRPTVVVGLRMQDRRLENFPEFLVQLLHRLHGEFGPLRVVIDGLNTKACQPRGGSFKLYSEAGLDSLSLIDKEDAVAQNLRDGCADLDIDFIDCIGSTLEINLHFISRADFFVSLFGSGLVKYRWIYNLPGFVLASAMNIKFSSLFWIYHTEKFMEDPTEMLVNDIADVEDIFPSDMKFQLSGKSIEPWSGDLSVLDFRLVHQGIHDRIVCLMRRTFKADSI